MDIPRFSRPNLDPDLTKGELWQAFEVFVCELLRSDYPHMRTFQAGKDGAIDLSHTYSETRIVVQCKYIGSDGNGQAAKEWQKVAGNLRKHLKDPSGPTSGQAQYRPWYETDPTIKRFIYCVSSQFKNQKDASQLKEDIRKDFRELACQHTHLGHLKGIDVEVLDWESICNLLREPERKYLVYRWFLEKRQCGLLPLTDAPRTGSFRAHLSSSRLPYYSRSTHLETHPAPEGVTIPNEDDLLGYLDSEQINGLILTGVGGVGKTRLTLEVGHLARRRGWLVFHAAQGLKHEDLSALAKDLTPADRVLLLIDYVELQQDFDQVIEELNLLNETYRLHLRYVANCRASYYSRIEGLECNQHIDVTPPTCDAAYAWLDVYRRYTVRHILESASGLQDTEKYLAACGDSPILAVFLAYLNKERKVTDLHDLLNEQDFGTWVRRRVQVSFQQRDIGRDLAILVSFFPMTDTAARGAVHERFEDLFSRLAQDGWIERSIEDQGILGSAATFTAACDSWVSAHDVLVDRILASYLQSVSATASHFLEDLLETAVEAGCLRSALISCQRLADLPVLSDVDWQQIFARRMTHQPDVWREARDIIVRTPLLTLEQTLSLLSSHEDVWEGIQAEAHFQVALGWIGRAVARQDQGDLDPTHRTTLLEWIKKTSPLATLNNAIITAGLLLSPETVRGEAITWIRERSSEFQTHYLLVAWLKAGLLREDVAEQVGAWAARFARNTHLSFIAPAWLNAGGDKDLVQAPIKAWLTEHQTTLEAEFVYSSWLNAGGDKDLVQEPIKAWLAEHQTTLDAGFVYPSWLNAGGDKNLVQAPIVAWLPEHQTALDTQFIYKSWLDAGGDKNLVQAPIKAWLAKNQTALEAQFVYKSWLNAGGDKGMVQAPIKAWLPKHQTTLEAGFVYKSWLDAGGDKNLVQAPIVAWLPEHKTALEAGFVYKSWLDTGGDFDLVRLAVIGWLHRYAELPDAVYVTKYVVNQADLPLETVEDILKWCRCNSDNPDVLWRLTGLRRHLFRPELCEPLCETAEKVVQYQLDRKEPLHKTTPGQIASLFSFLTSHTAMWSGPFRNRVDRLLCSCLRHSAVYGQDTPAFPTAQRKPYFRRIRDLIDFQQLDIERDKAAIRRFLEWVNTWETQRKLELRPEISFLKQWHPETTLWDIVQLD